MLAALEAVDLVVVFEEDTPLELIKRVRPAVLVKGADYTHRSGRRPRIGRSGRRCRRPGRSRAGTLDDGHGPPLGRVRRAGGPVEQASRDLTCGDASHDQLDRAARHRSHALAPGDRLARGRRRRDAAVVNVRDRHFHRALARRGAADVGSCRRPARAGDTRRLPAGIALGAGGGRHAVGRCQRGASGSAASANSTACSFIPMLLMHFRRSERGMWVLYGFFAGALRCCWCPGAWR